MPLGKFDLGRLNQRYARKRVAITGAGSGLGESLAIELAKQGWSLWLNDCDVRLLQSIETKCKEYGVKVYAAHFNVADLAAFKLGVQDFLQSEKGVDLVFTCAGIGLGGPFLQAQTKHLQEVVDINLMGTIWAGKIFLPAMAKAGRGHFVTIASAAAFHSLPHLAGYAATKAGVVQFSETLRSEMKPHGVDVTTKLTTFYTSSIAEHTRGAKKEREKARSLVQMAPWGSEDVAKALLMNVQKKKFYMVAPQQARFLWRFKRLLPELYLRLMPNLFSKLEEKLLKKAAQRKDSNK